MTATGLICHGARLKGIFPSWVILWMILPSPCRACPPHPLFAIIFFLFSTLGGDEDAVARAAARAAATKGGGGKGGCKGVAARAAARAVAARAAKMVVGARV